MTVGESTMGKLKRKAGRLIERIRLVPLMGKPSWRVIGGSFSMWIDPGDLMDQMFYLGNYETDLVELVRRWVRSGDHCLDVGAHKGFVTHHCARRVGPTGLVVSFEPDPAVRSILEKNLARNEFSWVTVSSYAAGAGESEMTYYLSSQSGWSSMYPNAMAAPRVREAVKVPVRSLDALWKDGGVRLEKTNFRFMKIDCEGAEPLVLRGAADLLRQSHPLVWIEINPDSLRVAGSHVGEVAGLLRGAGYDLYRIAHPGSLTVERLDELTPEPPAYDVIALKPALLPEFRAAGFSII